MAHSLLLIGNENPKLSQLKKKTFDMSNKAVIS